jgi:hypothetical protein
VVALVAVAAAVPWLVGFSQAYRLRSAAWQLAGDLRLARQQALTTLRRHRLVFAEAAGARRLPTYRVERLEGPTWVPAGPGRGPVSLGAEVELEPGLDGRTVAFDARGRLPAGGRIRVRNAAGSYALRLDPVGRVEVCACRGGRCC